MSKNNISFMDLPAEIRNYIYLYALSFDGELSRKRSGNPHSLFLSLLRVNKAIEWEAAPIFYRNNAFIFDARECNKKYTGVVAYLVDTITSSLVVNGKARSKSRTYADLHMDYPSFGIPNRYVKFVGGIGIVGVGMVYHVSYLG